ncbi:MAG: ATP-binding cassette domain-containing protein [Alphaproteobacteria bacterium]|nr:ATP-binding cassette domain-containing protein [Alphaproteobacteria bacterium]
MQGADPILEVRGLQRHFVLRRSMLGRPLRVVRAVDGVDISVQSGSTLALVGESGSGKSTLGRCVARLDTLTHGTVHFSGRDVFAARGAALGQFRREVQTIFQDPFASLNPRRKIGDAIGDGPAIHGLMPKDAIRDLVVHLLKRVGLRPDHADRYPHEFSGGQRQRIAIARALALGPKFIVADEAVSSLDVSIRAQILNLLMDIQAERGLSFLFISHDLGVVRHVADEVAIMQAGKIVEQGPSDQIFADPRQPYTQALLRAVPRATIGRRGRGRAATRTSPPTVSPIR